MNVNDSIRQALKKGATPIPDVLSKGIVLSVNREHQTASIRTIDDDLIFENVSLSVGTGGISIEPTIDSLVVVGFTDQSDTDGYLVGWSSIDKIFMNANTLIQFNDGLNSGLVKVKELTQKLNTAENEISLLKARMTAFETVFNAHTHMVIAPAVPTIIPVPVAVIGDAAPLTSTAQSEIENKDVVH